MPSRRPRLALCAGLAASAAASLAQGEYSAEVVGITSAFYVRSGGGVGPSFTCTVGAQKRLLQISHSFGVGGGGEVWQHTGLVVTLHRQGEREAAPQVAMRIRLSEKKLPFEQQQASIYVGALPEGVHSPMHWEVHGREACPPQLCRMPQPEIAVWLSTASDGSRDRARPSGADGSSPRPPTSRHEVASAFDGVVAVAEPHCGWAAPLSAITFKSERDGNVTALEVDLSHWLARNVTSFKVWAVPLALGDAGMWQTRMVSLASLALRQGELESETMI